MKVKALVALKSKLLKPCKKLLQIFKFKLRKPFFIRSLLTRSRPVKKSAKSHPRTRVSTFTSWFRPRKQKKQIDRLAEDIRTMSENPGHDGVLFPSPITPNYVKACRSSKGDRVEDVDDACRSFENYLAEMIVEDGKVGDLADVEELLYCWRNLKCPVFINLVCRFYGELCMDLFSPEDD